MTDLTPERISRGDHLATLQRVDFFLTHILQGLLADGDLSVNRIDPKLLVDVAEGIAWEAMDRAAQMTDKILAGEDPG